MLDEFGIRATFSSSDGWRTLLPNWCGRSPGAVVMWRVKDMIIAAFVKCHRHSSGTTSTAPARLSSVPPDERCWVTDRRTVVRAAGSLGP